MPTAVADLHTGETVLDLGAGAGADVLISAKRVGPTGKAIGIDMTDEMLAPARANADAAGVDERRVRHKGYLEDLPLPDASIDVVISNCVINLAPDKGIVLARSRARPSTWGPVRGLRRHRRPRPGRRDHARASQRWTGCIAGALTEDEFRAALQRAGFDAVTEIREPRTAFTRIRRRDHPRTTRRLTERVKPAQPGQYDRDPRERSRFDGREAAMPLGSFVRRVSAPIRWRRVALPRLRGSRDDTHGRRRQRLSGAMRRAPGM